VFARELCLGGVVALALLLPLSAAGWAPRFAEPSLGEARVGGPISTLYGLGAVLLSVELGLHRSLVIALHGSLLSAPPAAGTLDGAAFALGVARLVGEAFALALALGLPLLASLWLLDAALALVGRAVGQHPKPSLAGLVRGPLFVLLGTALALPILSEVPAALRVALRLARELARDVGT
jgi:type III secretory pathway component EscT